MTSYASRTLEASGYRQVFTDSDDEYDNIVPVVQQSERIRSERTNIASHSSSTKDADRFVQNIYSYHQRGGLLCMLVEDVLQLLQFAVVVSFSFYFLECVDYTLLLRNSNWLPASKNETWWNELPADVRAWLDRLLNGTDGTVRRKLTLSDVLEPVGQCMSHSGGFVLYLLLVAVALFFFRTLRFAAHVRTYLHTRRFLHSNLGYNDSSELLNATWIDVQQRLVTLCRNGGAPLLGVNVDELHIHQRLQRYRNYLIALAACDLLPVRFRVPFMGYFVYLPNALLWNVQFALFRSPLSPFRGGERLTDEFLSRRTFESQRRRLAVNLSRQLVLLGLVNLALFPVIAVFQVLHAVFQYTALLRENLAALSTRRWTNYARLRLRHYNELDEHFNKRLACAYRPATEYLAGFRSRFTVLFTRTAMFVVGAFLAVFILLSLVDSDVLLMDNVLAIMTALTLALSACRSLLPDSSGYFNPEYLFFKYASYVDYVHVAASDRATYGRLVRDRQTRQRVAETLQYRLTALLEELFSPFATPLMLIFRFAPVADSLVSYFHTHTVRVDSLGDVCSGAQFDLRQKAYPLWTASLAHSLDSDSDCDSDSGPKQCEAALGTKQDEQAAEKLIMSLVHFHAKNPQWLPQQPEQSRFLSKKLEDEQDAESSAEPPFLTSMCESIMRDQFGIGVPVRRNFNTMPQEPLADTHGHDSVARSVMFVRARYEANKRELAERKTSPNLKCAPDMEYTSRPNPVPIRPSEWTTVQTGVHPDGNELRYDAPPSVLVVTRSYDVDAPLGLDSLPPLGSPPTIGRGRFDDDVPPNQTHAFELHHLAGTSARSNFGGEA